MLSPGILQDQLSQQFSTFASHSIIKRLWEKDHTIWRDEEVHKKSILNRLGWLQSIELMLKNAEEVTAFAEEIKKEKFTSVVLLGMGGSSLCPDVCRTVFGSADGFPALLVLDSTNPTSVKRIEQSIDLVHTLFIVASKSGGTTETNMFYQYFYDRVASVTANPGHHFIAVTDADTAMQRIAQEKKFRKIFINPADIGGRYSALSYFGIVPMALIGMDIQAILRSAEEMRRQCQFEPVQNPAAQIGLMMGEAHNESLDKMTFILSKELSSFGYWAEQLIAESSGKEGKGILPIEGEPIAADANVQQFSKDRFYVFILLEKDLPRYTRFQNDLANNNVPYADVVLNDLHELGSQFFLWEFATAVSAIVMKINPFDEPNVKESKDNTVRVIKEFQQTGHLPVNNVVLKEGPFTVYGEPGYAGTLDRSSISAMFKRHCAGKRNEDYIALLAFIDQNPAHEQLMYTLREELSRLFSLPATVGFGPRYLHSTGQLHKGGKQNGIFIIITSDEKEDVMIPGEKFSFGVLKAAQALGDYRSFAGRNIRLLHLHITGDPAGGLQLLKKTILQ